MAYEKKSRRKPKGHKKNCKCVVCKHRKHKR